MSLKEKFSKVKPVAIGKVFLSAEVVGRMDALMGAPPMPRFTLENFSLRLIRFCRAEAPPFRAGEEARLLCGIDPPTTMSQKLAISGFEILSKPFACLNGM